MSSLLVPRMLAAGSFVISATAFRVGVGSLELWAERAPPLARQAARASLGGPEASTAQAAFRDDLIALARDWTEVSWRELRRGVADLDKHTRHGDRPTARPTRPYKAKP